MVYNHYWYAWLPTGIPTGLNALCDYITINSTDGTVPGTDPLNASLFLFYIGMGPNHGIELDLYSTKAGANQFWAIIDFTSNVSGPVNGHIFTMPVVVGHKYMREMKIRTNPLRCRFVVQDLTAGTVEVWEGNIASDPISELDDGLEWQRHDGQDPFEPNYHATVTGFGYSTNGGSSYKEFTDQDMKIDTGADPTAFTGTWPLGGLTVNGSSEPTTQPPDVIPPPVVVQPPKYTGQASPGDIRFFFSGGIGNSVGQFSLGGGISLSEIPTYLLDAIFDDVTPAEAKSGVAGEYRCIYLKNISADAKLANITIWSPSGGSIAPDDVLYFGLGSAPKNGVEQTIGTTDTAPKNVQFYPEGAWTLKTPQSLPDLEPGEFIALWIWRKVKPNARSFSRDQAILEVDYFTPTEPTDTGPSTGTCPNNYKWDSALVACVRESGGGGSSPTLNGHNVSLLYATLPTTDGRYFELMSKSQGNISQVDFQSTVSEKGGTQPNIYFKLSSQDQVRVEVGTTDRHGGFDDKTGIACLDTAFLAKQTYMGTAKDWRNYEATWYLLVHSYSTSTSSGEAHMELEGRCGYNSTDSTSIGSNPTLGRWCEATKYNFNCYFTGRTKFEKCLEHTNGYSKSNPEKTNVIKNYKGVWTGFKQVVYNIPGTTSKNGQGPDVKIEGYIDEDGDNTATPANKWKKIIEAVDHGDGAVFGPPRGTYHCGKDQYIPVSWGGPLAIFRWDHLDAEFKWLSIYELDPAIKAAGQGGTGGVDKGDLLPPIGTAHLYYETIGMATLTYDAVMKLISMRLIDTLTCPELDNPAIQVTSGGTPTEIGAYCYTVDGMYNTSPNQENLRAYWSDTNLACVVPGANSISGSKTSPISILKKGTGAILDKGPKVFLIFWGSEWSTRATEPTKDGIETRVRDFLLGRDLTYFSALSQYGIRTTPTYGRSCINTVTPIPTGTDITTAQATTAINDSIQKCIIDSPVLYPTNNAIYILIPPTNKTTVGGGAGTIHGWYSYDSGSAIPSGGGGGGGTGTRTEVYNVASTNTPNHLDADDYVAGGERIQAGNALVGQILTEVGFYLRKGGSPSGNATIYIRKSDHSIMFTFGNIDVATLTTTMQYKSILREDNTYALQAGDSITIEYPGGSSSNYLAQDEANTSTLENSIALRQTSGGTWTEYSGKESCGIWYTGVAGTGTGTGSHQSNQYQPFTTVYDVPLSSSS